MKNPENFRITKYKWNNGKLDVYQDVHLSNRNLQEIPFDFNIVYGSFYCFQNKLKSLKGCPKEVHGDFDCSFNKLKSLEGCPEEIHEDFDCSFNNLISLEGFPKEIPGDFDFGDNPIKTIKEFPVVKGKIYSDFSADEINKMIKLESKKDSIRSKMNLSIKK